MKYQLFTRSWKFDEKGNRAGFTRKSIQGYANSIDEAREKCQNYNSSLTKKQDQVGHKMEFTSDFK